MARLSYLSSPGESSTTIMPSLTITQKLSVLLPRIWLAVRVAKLDDDHQLGMRSLSGCTYQHTAAGLEIMAMLCSEKIDQATISV